MYEQKIIYNLYNIKKKYKNCKDLSFKYNINNN